MAISIYEKDYFRYEFIPNFINRDSDQLDPCFTSFKRIDKIAASSIDSDFLIAKLQMIGKASVRIDLLCIGEDDFRKLIEFYKDKEVSLIIESLLVTSFKKR